MGIKQQLKKLTGSGNIRKGCQFDHQTGKFRCETRRVHDGGQEEIVGVVAGQLDGGCNTVLDEMWESEDGVLNSMDKEFISKIKGRCARTESKPEDY